MLDHDEAAVRIYSAVALWRLGEKGDAVPVVDALMTDKDASPAIGIDLGTTFSVVAHIDETGHPITLANAAAGVSWIAGESSSTRVGRRSALSFSVRSVW